MQDLEYDTPNKWSIWTQQHMTWEKYFIFFIKIAPGQPVSGDLSKACVQDCSVLAHQSLGPRSTSPPSITSRHQDALDQLVKWDVNEVQDPAWTPTWAVRPPGLFGYTGPSESRQGLHRCVVASQSLPYLCKKLHTCMFIPTYIRGKKRG